MIDYCPHVKRVMSFTKSPDSSTYGYITSFLTSSDEIIQYDSSGEDRIKNTETSKTRVMSYALAASSHKTKFISVYEAYSSTVWHCTVRYSRTDSTGKVP